MTDLSNEQQVEQDLLHDNVAPEVRRTAKRLARLATKCSSGLKVSVYEDDEIPGEVYVESVIRRDRYLVIVLLSNGLIDTVIREWITDKKNLRDGSHTEREKYHVPESIVLDDETIQAHLKWVTNDD